MTSQPVQIRIYGGLSISQIDVLSIIPDAHWSGPVQAGDILKDIKQGCHVIGIIDGNFFENQAATSSEILDAIRCGLRVYGSSGLGALRAVEMEPYGMTGCGKVFELIKRTPVFMDDYLGQSFSKDGFSATSVPYVDVVFEAEKKTDQGLISATEAQTLLKAYSEISFLQRNSKELKSKLRDEFSGSSADQKKWDQVADTLFAGLVSQRRTDALVLAQRIRDDLDQTRKLNEKLWAIQAASRTDKDFFL